MVCGLYADQRSLYLSMILLILQSISFKGCENLQFVFGPSIETCIISLRANVLTESLNLARISSAFVCPQNLES